MGHPHLVDPRDGLTARQRLAVDLLAKGHTCRHVAQELGVTERTIYAYRKKPAVMQAVLRAQEDLMSQGGSRGVSTIPQAVETLAEIMNDPEARHADRIAASKALLGGAEAYSQRKILERQLQDMEALLRDLTGGPAGPGDLPPEDAYGASDPDDEGLDLLLPSANVPEDEDDDPREEAFSALQARLLGAEGAAA